MTYSAAYDPDDGVAIVGIAGRFPGARNVAQFWRNLVDGRETISHFRDNELDPASATETAARGSPDYVRARGILDDVDMFDARFFGINPKEAEVLDPQHRVFLETAWEALEDAGHVPQRFDGLISVFASANENTYYLRNLLARNDVTDAVGAITMMTSVMNDYLATRVAYKLDLKGPALTIQTACSSSLVAVCTAVQSLLCYQSDMALAGGVSILLPQRRGYLWQDGSITSRDGHCRAFDADAQGTVFSNGVGIVVLRRLRDALDDGDNIYAVIKGAAVNNDGSVKVSFTAPSVDGQAQVISMAQAQAGIDPESISYVEAHGTGTSLGDPVEIAALTQAFRAGGAQGTGFCAVGSLKTNVGHMDIAAGVGGLIKTALALYHRQLPATLHFRSPNPQLGLENTPFYVNAGLQPWMRGDAPRRAAVSALGVGGTNAHVVLEEAPPRAATGDRRARQLLVLSARSPAALDRAGARLQEYLESAVDVDLDDAAHTLQVGRRAFGHRRALVCSDRSEAIRLLAQPDPKRVFSGNGERPLSGVAFMFPGQGAQHVNMARTLYESEPRFAAEVDECSEVLRPHLGEDLRKILYPSEVGAANAQERITQTGVTQPALFVVEYALARLWMSWGVEPAAMIGHSLGEYVAACIAGVFTRDDALWLLARRARMMQDLPSGSMLAVRARADDLVPALAPGTSIAAVNAPNLTVVSGDHEAVAELEARFAARQIAYRRLATSHAFHSPMLDPIVESFAELVRGVRRSTPTRRWISSLTGQTISDAEATDPSYWSKQMRQTVRFMDGVGNLMDSHLALLEVGPGQSLASLARQHPGRKHDQPVLTTLHPGQDYLADLDCLFATTARLWSAGTDIDWRAVQGDSKRRRVSLPTYPFERVRHWVMPAPETAVLQPTTMAVSKHEARLPAAADAASVVGAGAPLAVVDGERESPVLASVAASTFGNPTALWVERLSKLFSELSGIESAALDPELSFLEMGFDSLTLIQASRALQKNFGVNVSPRDLSSERSTLQALAAFIVDSLDADMLG